MVKYEYSESLQVLAEDVVRKLFPHIPTSRIKCFRSLNSDVEGIVARCHALGKIMQQSLGCDAFYAIEFIREKFDDLPTEKKVKLVIRELMYISEKFDGSFSNFELVNEENIEFAYQNYLTLRKEDSKIDFFKKIRK